MSENPSDKSNISGNFSVFNKGIINWNIKDFRVSIEPKNIYNGLNESSRASLFNTMLAEVRKRSEHPLYAAVLAITQSGNIFVANNTQREHEFHKSCAEVNAINIITQLCGTKEKIERLYLMLGKETATKDTPPEKLEKPYAPCGKCVDALCNCSTKEAIVTMFPANDGTLLVKSNHEAHHFGEVERGETWVTRLSQLALDKEMPMTDKEKMHYQRGWEALTNPDPLVVKAPSDKEIGRLINRKSSKSLSPEDEKLRAVILRAARNAATRRESEAALDVDHSLSGINQFMVQRIADAYRRRSPIEGKPGEHNVDQIRCAVIRLADGSFHFDLEVEGPEENAVTHPEITVANYTRHLHQPITDVWVMSVNCKNPKEDILHTSPKESLERLDKRGHIKKQLPTEDQKNPKDIYGNPTQGNINMHYIVFNNGMLDDDEVEKITLKRKMTDIYISNWKGTQYMRREEGFDVPNKIERG